MPERYLFARTALTHWKIASTARLLAAGVTKLFIDMDVASGRIWRIRRG